MILQPTDGELVYYSIQHTLTHQSRIYGNPDTELVEVPESEDNWQFSSWDHFRMYGPVRPEDERKQGMGECVWADARTDRWNVYKKTGNNGWFLATNARRVLKYLQEQNEQGAYDTTDPGTGALMRRIRYKFRIVECTLMFSYKVVPSVQKRKRTPRKTKK